MAGWLGQELEEQRWRQRQAALLRWLDVLRRMPDEEVGMVLAVATDLRHRLEAEYKVDLLEPHQALTRCHGIVAALESLVTELDRQDRADPANGARVWLATLAAAERSTVELAHRQWRELQRGLAHVEGAAHSLYVSTLEFPRIDGFDRTPVLAAPAAGTAAAESAALRPGVPDMAAAASGLANAVAAPELPAAAPLADSPALRKPLPSG